MLKMPHIDNTLAPKSEKEEKKRQKREKIKKKLDNEMTSKMRSCRYKNMVKDKTINNYLTLQQSTIQNRLNRRKMKSIDKKMKNLEKSRERSLIKLSSLQEDSFSNTSHLNTLLNKKRSKNGSSLNTLLIKGD